MTNSLQVPRTEANESSKRESTSLNQAAVRSSGTWRTLNLRQLQHFETELQAKGYLPAVKGSNRNLTQHISQEIAHWRWCAKRMGIDGEVQFVIDLKGYLSSRIAELQNEFAQATTDTATQLRPLAAQLTRWSDEPQNQLSLAHALEYLETFAAVLSDPEVKNLYKKALRDTLMLNLARLKNSAQKVALRLVLPLSREELRARILLASHC